MKEANEPLHKCGACGKLVHRPKEADGFIWVCNDCFRILEEVLSDPDCNLDLEEN